MTILDIILAVKIIGTGAFAALPFLLLPASKVGKLLGVGEPAIPLVRLYGVALLALLVGYSFGFSWVTGSKFPWGVVSMGLASNGLGSLTMIMTGSVARARGLFALIATITAALAFSALSPGLVMQPL